MAMMYLAVSTWLFFVIASAVTIQVMRKRALNSLNRKYVKAVDDTFYSFEQMVKGIDKKQDEVLLALATTLNNLTLILNSASEVMELTRDMESIQLNVAPTVEAVSKVTASTGVYITNLEYARDRFAKTQNQKRAIDAVILNIKKEYGHTSTH